MNSTAQIQFKNRFSGPREAGFTLVELLVVLGTIGFLALILLPALAGTKPDVRSFQCLNNTKRLTAGWLMYANDYNDQLMSANNWIGSGSYLDWVGGSGNWNTNALIDPGPPDNALMASYVRSVTVFKCPSDTFQSPGNIAVNPAPRVRSYSLNGAAGGNVAKLTPNPNNPQYPLGRTYSTVGAATMSQLNLPGPANVWVMLDEHPDSINDGNFHFNAGYLPSSYQWRDMPASYHNGGCCFSFADGHSDIHRWLETGKKNSVNGQLVPPTVLPVLYQAFPKGVPGAGPLGFLPCPYSQDYAWMNNGMPYR